MAHEDPVERQLVHYNRRDVDGFAPCFSDDVVVEDGDGNVLMTGRAALRDWYAVMFANHPALHCEILRRTRVGSRFVVDEERILGRGPEPLHVVAVYRVRGAEIDRVVLLRP